MLSLQKLITSLLTKPIALETLSTGSVSRSNCIATTLATTRAAETLSVPGAVQDENTFGPLSPSSKVRMVRIVDRSGAQSMGSMWVLCKKDHKYVSQSPIRSGNPPIGPLSPSSKVRMVRIVDRSGAQSMGSMWVLCKKDHKYVSQSPIRSGNPLEISLGERCPGSTSVRQLARSVLLPARRGWAAGKAEATHE